jgi:MFS family permease
MIRTLSYIWMVFVAISVCLISRKPKDRVDHCLKRIEMQKKFSENQLDDNQEEIRSLKYCFYSLRFWQYFSLMLLCNFFPTFFNYTYKTYGEDKALHKPINDLTLSWAASIGSGLVNGMSRLTCGWLNDKFSFRHIMMVLMSIEVLVAVSVYWVVEIVPIYFLCVLLNYFAGGGLFAVFPNSVTRLFGLRVGPQIYSVILLASILSSTLNLVMVDVLLDSMGFAACFYLSAIVTGVAVVVLYFFEETLDTERLYPVNGIIKIKEGRESETEEGCATSSEAQ